MEHKKNEIKVSAPASTLGLHISTTNTKQVISATNNRAQYYADLAKKYRDEAKQHRDNAKYYAEQNSDVTVEYILEVKADVLNKMNEQKTEIETNFETQLPKNVSELNNDIPYVSSSELELVTNDLENKDNETLEIIENISNEILNKSQITNCLLEVPQNIKLELNNGTLTLKAGSKVIVPNGVNVFDEVAVVKDYSISGIANNSQVMLYYRADEGGLDYMALSHNYSGNTAPTFTGNYAKWYDTANNIMKATSDGGATWEANYSLPLCVFSTDNNGSIISIDQVFNGFGYIGVHFWVDKGVKGLSAFGRNADGTLNNTEFVTNRVIVGTTGNTNHYNTLFLDVGTNVNVKVIKSYYADFIHKINSRAELPLATAQNYQYYFIEDESIWVMNGTTGVWNKTSIVEVGNLYHGADGSITNFETNNVFRAVDYNEFNKSINTLNKAYITETYSNGYSWYRIWSDGWCEQGGRVTLSSGSTTTVTLLKNYANIDYNINLEIRQDGFNGDKWMPYINAEPTVSSFVVKNSTSSTTLLMWRACGYIS